MTASEVQIIGPWFISLAVITVGLVLSLTSLVFGRLGSRVAIRFGSSLALLGLCNVAGVYFLSLFQTYLPTWTPFAFQLFAMIFGGIVVGCTLRMPRRRPVVLPCLLLVASVGCLALVLKGVDSANSGDLDGLLGDAGRPPQLPNPIPQLLVHTDKGFPIRLFTRDPERMPRQPGTDALAARLARRVIETEAVNFRYNCHGWTFAGGKYLVLGDEVPEILRDNGYQVVQHPRAGDVIIYYAAGPDESSVVHSGIVRAVSPDGLVLVESKWGDAGARYLHEPKIQPYSDVFKYFRTSRPSHVLAGIAPPATDAVDGLQMGVADLDDLWMESCLPDEILPMTAEKQPSNIRE